MALRTGWGAIGAPATVAAETILQCWKNQVAENSGAYFMNARPASPASVSEDPALQEFCWNLSF